MTYDENAAIRAIIEWDLPRGRKYIWQKRDEIPDRYALELSMDKAERRVYYIRLLGLIGDGWVNTWEVCQSYGWANSYLTDIMMYHRDPENYPGREMDGNGVAWCMEKFLLPLERSASSILLRAKLTPPDQMYSQYLREDLLKLLQMRFLKPSRIWQNMTPTKANMLRKWSIGERQGFDKLSDKPLLMDAIGQIERAMELLCITIK